LKALAWISCVLLGLAMLYVATNFPSWGDPNSPASVHLSPHYIEQVMPETSVPNIVSALLADYRGYDTMFETAVVFTAAMACFFILRVLGCEVSGQQLYRHLETGILIRSARRINLPIGSSFKRVESVSQRYDFITAKVCRLMIPFLQIFGLYVIAHGHHSPGGGFQGGVILGAAWILLAISHDLQSACDRYAERKMFVLVAAGVLIYAGTGVLAMFYGGNFLDYSYLGPLFGMDPIASRSFGIFVVEVGVGFTVMATMILLYNFLASAGRCDEGL